VISIREKAQSLIYFLKNCIVTLRFSILSVFTVLFVTSMLLLISITYYRFSTIMSYVSLELMNRVSSSVYDTVVSEIENVKNETAYSARLVQTGALNYQNLNDILAATYSLVMIKGKSLPSITSVAWSDESGNFVQSQKQIDGSSTSNIINRFLSPVTSTVINRSANNVITTAVYTKDIIFDPRKRFWYTDARDLKTTAVSDIYQYIYYGVKYWGITISSPSYTMDGKFRGVFAIQMGMNFLKNFLENIKYTGHGKVFIVTDSGNLIAFPHLAAFDKQALVDIHHTSFPWVSQSFDLYKKNGKKEFIFNQDNKTYVATYHTIPQVGLHNWLIGVVVPESDFIGELITTNYITIAVSFIILLLGIYLVSMIITRIVRPMNQLADETEHIKKFELNEDIHIQSRIKEVMLLTNALSAMKKSLRSFQKYVPATLVRQIIDAGEDAHVGGAKKQVAILFSDIQDFTSIVEYEEPEEIMSRLCEYFDVISNVILQERGTIDKYIGDSIMVFWGAPLSEANPAYQAAKAALRCIKKVTELNLNWQQQGKAVFVTRFGLHIGNAVVGNLGSSERLNYTAIGSSINTASRLEGANKFYGTSIIVSENMYHMIRHEFILRMIDCVALKGQAETGFIYELLAEKGELLSFDVVEYNLLFSQGFKAYQHKQWDVAINFFQQCLIIYSDDTVAKIFIDRCEFFKVTPADDGWNGVYYINNK
jgi:adenylate cyclase